MICRHKSYHFTVANLSLTWSGKTGICDHKMIRFMPANHSNTNHVITILILSDKMHFQNVFIMLLRPVAKDVTSSLLSWHKRNDFNAVKFFDVMANENGHYKPNELEFYFHLRAYRRKFRRI